MSTRYLLSSAVREVSQLQLATIAAAINAGRAAFASAWGLPQNCYEVDLASRTQAPPQHAIATTIVADLIDPDTEEVVTDALAWHYEDGDGIRHIDVGYNAIVAAGGGLYVGDASKGAALLSVTSALDHEAKENEIDPACNGYALRASGTELVAYEVCDPAESDGYIVAVRPKAPYVAPAPVGCALSNFVYPAWFDPNAPAGTRLDYLGVCGKPLEVAPGGYLVKLTTTGGSAQEDGELATPRLSFERGERMADFRRRTTPARIRRRLAFEARGAR